MTTQRLFERALAPFPRLRGLPDDLWRGRHRAMVTLLWAHAPALFVYGTLVAGHGMVHGLLDALPIVGFAIAAQHGPLGRSARASIASLGLVVASALVVHVAGGAIEAHFHFFVMLPVIGLYQDWRPFGLAVLFVVLHHFGFALFFPHDVYPDASSWQQTLGSTAIHAAFVVAEIAALLASWKLGELRQLALDAKNAALDARNDELDGTVAQQEATVARLDAAMAEMAGLTARVRQSTMTLTASSQEILEAVGESSDAAAAQSSSIEATSLAASQLRQTADGVAREADDLRVRGQRSLAATDAGTNAIESIVAGMGDIHDRMRAIAGDIAALSTQTERIGVLTASVTELADRSNLLALNASIEAARAGEHGRGFAVVAQEVRVLAEQSKETTGEVRSILDELGTSAAAAVASAESGRQVVEHGMGLAVRARDIIVELAEANRAAATGAEQIAESARTQNGDTDRIAEAMARASESTRGFVRSTEGSQAVASRLGELARELDALTARCGHADVLPSPARPVKPR